ncbi:hypothetical protein QA447_07165 [Pseudomonas sp. abacavir_1]
MDINYESATLLIHWLMDHAAEAVYGAIVLGVSGKLWKLAIRAIRYGPVFVRRWKRRSQRRFTLKLRKYALDSMLLSLEISRSSTYLILFWVSGMLWLISTVFALIFIPAAHQYPNLTVGLAALPMYCFELAWVFKSNHVTDALKRRQRIALRKANLHKQTSMPTLEKSVAFRGATPSLNHAEPSQAV